MATKMEMKWDLNNPENVQELIETQESDIYSTVNEDGEQLVVMLDQGQWMEVTTYQSNGWTRIDSFNASGLKEDVMYCGRWE